MSELTTAFGTNPSTLLYGMMTALFLAHSAAGSAVQHGSVSCLLDLQSCWPMHTTKQVGLPLGIASTDSTDDRMRVLYDRRRLQAHIQCRYLYLPEAGQGSADFALKPGMPNQWKVGDDDAMQRVATVLRFLAHATTL